MVKIEIKKNPQEKIIGYKLEGHANYADYGEDIVCSAISLLAQNTFLSLIKICGIKEEEMDYSIIDEKAYFDVNLKNGINSEEFSKSQIVLKTFELGIKSVIESYPNFATLKYRRCER